jgi:uncharacterized phage-like protein YoqJ
MIAIAWTGHRPQDLGTCTYQQFAAALDALGMGKRRDVRFIVGGALGIDQWAAEYAIAHAIPFEVVLPFQIAVMTKPWSQQQRASLIAQCNKATDVRHLSLTYDVRAYQDRNMAMVDDADYVFAVWTGKRAGGTANCLRYALTCLRPTFNLFPLDGKLRPIKAV